MRGKRRQIRARREAQEPLAIPIADATDMDTPRTSEHPMEEKLTIAYVSTVGIPLPLDPRSPQ